ncbi:MAG: 50S ribosomal protein L5, partial [Vicinamibacterales bacterium]|nr:50S ribosomal protein L5 [Vicinamibacterales bacterium]
MSRLKERYLDQAVSALTKEFGYTSVMAVPKIQRIAVNMGMGEATQNAKLQRCSAHTALARPGSPPGATLYTA